MSSIKTAGVVAAVLLAAGVVGIIRHGRAQPEEASTFAPESMNDFKKPEATELKKKLKFHPAEEYHQKYLVKHPGGYTCHVLRD